MSTRKSYRSLIVAVGIAVALSASISGFAAPARIAASAEQPGTLSLGKPIDVPPSAYQARRKRALTELKDGILVLRGSLEEEYGEVGRFRQNNWFHYLTGVEVPGAYLILNPMGAPDTQEILFLPGRNPMHERWTGPKIGPGKEAKATFGIETVDDRNRFPERLREALASAPAGKGAGSTEFKIYTILPQGHFGKYSMDQAFIDLLRTNLGDKSTNSVSIVDAAPLLSDLRRVKDQHELALLQRAIDITGDAQTAVARRLEPGVYEYELESAIIGTFLRHGALRAGFPSIVGSGIYSTILHYNENTKRVDAGDLVVVDIGAEYRYYTADITRTWPASGEFSPRQKEIYELVLDAQKAAEEGFRPGMRLSDLHGLAVERMRKSPLRDASGATLDKYFIHGLGHYLGMDVHDVGSYQAPLKPGDVFTIEPGIYIPDEKLGVRIEDDYLVTEKGLVKLSKNIPSTVADIEKLLSGR